MDDLILHHAQSGKALTDQYFQEVNLLKQQYIALGNLGLQIILSIAKDPSAYYVFCP